jgi:hypothetical protein
MVVELHNRPRQTPGSTIRASIFRVTIYQTG